jgi:[ribosomal protein S5]-alanine N-acetyltransferase
MREYFLTSARLGFSTWTKVDLPLAMGLWDDPDVTKFTGGPFTLPQIGERLATEISNFKQHGIQYWPIFFLTTGEHVGCCGFRPYDLLQRVYEFGFQLRRVFWSRGLGREAAEAAVAHGFTACGASALRAGHHPSNDVSRRLLHRLGFSYTHDEFYSPTQQIEPCYRLTGEEYAKRNVSA